MPGKKETRRVGRRKRVSQVVTSRNSVEVTNSALDLQAAFIASRFALSAAVARVVAEHAFAREVGR